MKRANLIRLTLPVAILLFGGCASFVYHGGTEEHRAQDVRLLLPPFHNATDDIHASRALTELTGTAILERGLPLYQTEESIIRTNADTAAGPDGRYAQMARDAGATHLLIGTVHEYRYKTDLNGDPAVGITMRLIDAEDGRTVWQGSSGNVGFSFASLTSASHSAVRNLLLQAPIYPKEPQSFRKRTRDKADRVGITGRE